MGSLMDIMNLYNQFKQNPMGMLMQRYNIPQNITSPQDIVQHLLNTNQVSQAQVNQAMAMKNSPQFKNMFR